MLPLIALSISASFGCGFSASSAAAVMIWPGWQYPHCGTPSSTHACCTGWLPSADRPSMVVIRESAATPTSVMQERAARPSRWTVQAPHCATPQPNLVPLRPRTSRSTQSSGMLPSTSTLRRVPLTLS